MGKVDYLRFLAGHPSATVAESAKGLGATEVAVLSAFKRLVRGKLAESSGSPPRFRLTPEGEARLRSLSNQPSESNPLPAGDLTQRVASLEVKLAALAGRLSSSENAEEEIAADLETLFSAVDRLLDSKDRTNGKPQPDGAQSQSGRGAQLLDRAAALVSRSEPPEEATPVAQFHDALCRGHDVPWFKRGQIRGELDALEAQLDSETVKAVHRLRELEQEGDSWLADEDEAPQIAQEIRSLREKLGLPAVTVKAEGSAWKSEKGAGES